MSEALAKPQEESESNNRVSQTSQDSNTTPTKEPNATKTSSPIKQLSSYIAKTLESSHKKKSPQPDRSSISQFIEELARLFSEDSKSSQSKKEDKPHAETSNNQQDSSNVRIYEKIKSIRLHSVKPELIINLIDEKLANLQSLNKAIEIKRSDISRITLELKKQLDDSLNEIKRNLEAKFSELNKSADEISKTKNEELNEIQKSLETSTGHMQRLKDILVQNFQGDVTDQEKYEANLAKLHAAKEEIQSVVQDMDPIDLQKAINQSKVRSFFKPSSLNEYIEKIHLIEVEIAGLRGLEDVSPPSLQDQKLFEKTTADRKSFVGDFQGSKDYHRADLGTQQIASSSYKALSAFLKPSVPISHTLETHGSVFSGDFSYREENSLLEGERFHTAPSHRDSRERFFPSKLLSPQPLTKLQRTQPARTGGVTSIVDIRAKGNEKNLGFTTSFLREEKTGNTFEAHKAKISNIRARHSLNTSLKESSKASTSTGSNLLDSLLKQKESFLRSSLNPRK